MEVKLFGLPKMSFKEYKNETLAGLTSAMTMIPESLSFAIIAGLAPIMGLYAAFIMGIVTAFLGGRPGMIAGGAGATIIVMIHLILDYGVEYLLAAVLLAGVIQFLVGVFKLGKFIRLVPSPVMYGFLNGLAVVIFISQLKQFGIIGPDGSFSLLESLPLYTMIALSVLTILVVVLLPYLTKAIPSSLVAILVVSFAVFIFAIDTKKVVDIAPLQQHLPSFHIPAVPLEWSTLWIILPYGLIMASVGLLESLLTLQMVDEITYTKGNANKEAKAQGYANMLCGVFGAMGGCAMVAQTMVNLNSGGRTRLSAIISALTILMILLFLGPVIGQIPLAALVGVMIVVAATTFKWSSFKLVFKMPRVDVFTGVLVALITIFLHNLALAVLVGILISALVFAWKSAQNITMSKKNIDSNVVLYRPKGPIFFGSIDTFLAQFDPKNDPAQVIVDFREAKVCDMSAIEALDKLTELYQRENKKIVLEHLSGDCYLILNNAKDVVKVNIKTDPTYKVMP